MTPIERQRINHEIALAHLAHRADTASNVGHAIWGTSYSKPQHHCMSAARLLRQMALRGYVYGPYSCGRVRGRMLYQITDQGRRRLAELREGR